MFGNENSIGKSLIWLTACLCSALNPGCKSEEGSVEKVDLVIKSKTVECSSPPEYSPDLSLKFYYPADGPCLPKIESAAAKPLSERTVRIGIPIWGGWAPSLWKNQGLKAGVEWQTDGKQPFKVEFVLMDKTPVMFKAFAQGEIHGLMNGLDQVALITDGLRSDKTRIPKVVMLTDWSKGADGIVSRGISSFNQLRGRKVVAARCSSVYYLMLNALHHSDLKASQVEFDFVGEPFEAAAAFLHDKSYAACATWAPDMYNLARHDNKLLLSTNTATRVISNVLAFRADFSRKHPEIVKGMVAGHLEALDWLKGDSNTKVAAPVREILVARVLTEAFETSWLSTVYLLRELSLVDLSENLSFFSDEDDPVNFERTWETISMLYEQSRDISIGIPHTDVMQANVIEALASRKQKESQP